MASRALMILAATAVLVGCSGVHNDLARSESAWTATKKTCSTYQYELDSASVFGFWSSTTVQISNDHAVLRTYAAGETSVVDGTRTTTTMWTENGAEVGTHADFPPAETMEQLYRDCDRNVLSQDPSKNDITFQADPRGVLTACWYYPHGCQDDCSVGVSVSNFACLVLD